MEYCTDVDLLHWEPNVFRDAAFASQTLLSGTGDLAGTTFTLDSGSLVAAKVTTDQVIALSGAVAGCFPVVGVQSATQLTLSVLYDGLYPDQGQPSAAPVGVANDLTFSIRTFWAQRRVMSDLLTQSVGLVPGSADAASTTILNPEALKRPCVLGTLHMIYSAMAAAAAEPADLLVRVELYERLYRWALRNAVVDLDTDGDGRANTRHRVSVVRLQRV